MCFLLWNSITSLPTLDSWLTIFQIQLLIDCWTRHRCLKNSPILFIVSTIGFWWNTFVQNSTYFLVFMRTQLVHCWNTKAFQQEPELKQLQYTKNTTYLLVLFHVTYLQMIKTNGIKFGVEYVVARKWI